MYFPLDTMVWKGLPFFGESLTLLLMDESFLMSLCCVESLSVSGMVYLEMSSSKALYYT